MKTKSTKSQIAKPILTKEDKIRRYFFLILIIVLAALLVGNLYSSGKAKQERANFDWASSRLEVLKKDIEETLEKNTPLAVKKYCYYGENASAYDQGKLRCRVTLSGEFDSAQSEIDSDKIMKLVSDNKYFGEGKPAVDSAVEGLVIENRNLICGQNIESTDRRSNPLTGQTGATPKIQVDIYCDQRATKLLFELN